MRIEVPEHDYSLLSERVSNSPLLTLNARIIYRQIIKLGLDDGVLTLDRLHKSLNKLFRQEVINCLNELQEADFLATSETGYVVRDWFEYQ